MSKEWKEWNEMLQRTLGGKITDWDSPESSSTVTGYSLEGGNLRILTRAGWEFGGVIKYFHFTDEGWGVRISGVQGMLKADIIYPEKAAA